jgi:hypothetical protein
MLIALPTVHATTTPAAAQVVDCHTYSDYPNTMISSARGLTCAAATKIMKSYRGDISRTFTVRTYRCSQVSGSQYGGQWRCVHGAKAFRFEFKD